MTALTVTAAVSALPFAEVAITIASPTARPETSPVAETVAIAAALELHVRAAPAIGALAASTAVPVSWSVAPMSTVATAGVTVTAATVAGSTGLVVPSLHAPNVFAAGAFQVPSSLRCRLCPTGVVLISETPMFVDVSPAAGPLLAVKGPSYDKSSTTALVASTSARPSLGPFWIPSVG